MKNAKPIWIPFVTLIGVIAQIYFINNLAVNFFVFWFLIILNFGFTMTAALIYIIFFPIYFIASYGRVAGITFIAINIIFGVFAIARAIKGLSNARK